MSRTSRGRGLLESALRCLAWTPRVLPAHVEGQTREALDRPPGNAWSQTEILAHLVNWYFDEVMALRRMQENQCKADRAQGLGLVRHGRCGAWERIRITLGRGLVGLGTRLQQAEPLGSPDLAPSSQCDLR